jgi:hypothetical protein
MIWAENERPAGVGLIAFGAAEANHWITLSLEGLESPRTNSITNPAVSGVSFSMKSHSLRASMAVVQNSESASEFAIEHDEPESRR